MVEQENLENANNVTHISAITQGEGFLIIWWLKGYISFLKLKLCGFKPS